MTHSNIVISNNEDILIDKLWVGYLDNIGNDFWSAEIIGYRTMYKIPTNRMNHSYEYVKNMALEYIDKNYDEILKLGENFEKINNF